MKLLNPQQTEVLKRLDELGLDLSVIRDFSSLLPWLWNDVWHTSISLRKVMRLDRSYTRKELNRLSSALANIYNNSELLKRQEKRKIYNRFWGNRNISHWAYTLDWEWLAHNMPNPEREEHDRLKAQIIFERSLE